MTQSSLTGATLLLSLLLSAAIAAPALAQPELRGEVVVSAPVIRLGDLFSDAGPLADIIVAPAPAPGSKATYDAAWLDARAREQKLAWQPRSRYDQATVERASEAISAEAVTAELKRELEGQLPPGLVQLDLDNPGLRLFVPAGAPTTVAVDNLSYDARSGRLVAYVGTADDAERVRITGHVWRMIEIPVLSHPVTPGDAITERDVDMIAVHSDRLTQSFVMNSGDLVGKTPRHPIRPGEPVRPTDIQVPILIHKGDLVTIVLQTSTLTLTAQAKALDDGVQGGPIRVTNTRSGRVLDAVVMNQGTVSVPTGSVVAAR
ncbi:MAG: flagellar basal body P-ring formation protein FlgA [Alphaproteobacteria bacterium]|nr:flagellar basal body P-ring formation protein FlgA [Alphaproteobacteria bacterium]